EEEKAISFATEASNAAAATGDLVPAAKKRRRGVLCAFAAAPHCRCRETRSSSISFSIRTYNSVSNSCPKITRMMAQLNELPLSIEKFNVRWEGGEPMIGKELLDSCVIHQRLNWICMD
ncbi:hypothetical protein S245_062282, partial [Arachis hypogaea]